MVRHPRLSVRQRVTARAIGVVGSPLVAALGRTLTWRVDGADYYDTLMRNDRAPILALFHARILPATLCWRSRGIVALTSQNFDGEWIARLMSRFGYRAARGSTSRGGARALVQLRRELAAGHPVAFTVDGPRGPARVVQPGVVWLAGATGHPILPFHIEANRHWTVRSWDRAQVPKPFSTVAVAVGSPLEVADTDRGTIERATAELACILHALEARTHRMLETLRAG
jgi:lysophospholipid acyltransferase (LPLAT)-like uncharacterized protein